MDYEIKIKINDIDKDYINVIIDKIDNTIDEWQTTKDSFHYSITSKEVKPKVSNKYKNINEDLRISEDDYIKLALHLNKKNNEKYNKDINNLWDNKKLIDTAEQFRLLIQNDKIQYNNHDLNYEDCMLLIDFALQKDQLYVIQSGASFRKKVESIIANKINYENRANRNNSNNNKSFMMPNKKHYSKKPETFIDEDIMNEYE